MISRCIAVDAMPAPDGFPAANPRILGVGAADAAGCRRQLDWDANFQIKASPLLAHELGRFG